MRVMLLLVSLTTGCALLGDAGRDTDPPPPPITARFVADAYLQDCRWSGEDWLGVRALRLTLHHRLDEVDVRELPAPGTCVSRLDLFDEESLPGGDPLPEFDGRPAFSSPEANGTLTGLVPGLWHADAFVSPERCGTLSESVGVGASLTDAGAFTDLTSPAATPFLDATADGQRFIDHAPVSFGDTVELEWQAEDWQAAFVQVRRQHEGELRETITCGAQGGSFSLDDRAWSQSNRALLADDNQIIVGLVREELVQTVDGSARAWMLLRALHVLDP